MRPATFPIAALSVLVLLVGCGDGESRQRADREAIAAAIEAYLPLLATAYLTGDVAPLETHAAQKEIATVERRILELAKEGRVFHPTLKQMTLEDVEIWSYSNAYATTLEVWDVEMRAAGSDRVISEDAEQRNRVKYQLSREGDRWLILYRALQP